MAEPQRTLVDAPSLHGAHCSCDQKPSRCDAARKLERAIQATGSALSVGLEPGSAALPRGTPDTLAGHERFLRTIVEATAGVAAAYKFNLAFFEALGPPGWELLHRVRNALPAGALVIADAKRGDIGSTAERYATAMYDRLGADSATVNPLMGRDACEPFLAYEDRLTFFLVLTSNPGASDFLLAGGLYREIARRVAAWNARGNAGMVVGATRPEHAAEIRAIAGDAPFLIPGVGAQGGDLEAVAAHGRTGATAGRAGLRAESAAAPLERSGLLFHVTRGVLPAEGEMGDPERVIRAKAQGWHDRIRKAMRQEGAR